LTGSVLHLVTERIEVAPDPGHGGGKKGAMGGTFNPDRVIVKFAA
jgi:N-acetylmuramoyl-L-alanine amidase